jgi:hypothetical protein
MAAGIDNLQMDTFCSISQLNPATCMYRKIKRRSDHDIAEYINDHLRYSTPAD